MGNTKRMAADEKKKVILNIFHSTQQVYLEKEVLVLAEKAGVSRGAIEGTLQELIDDGLVEKSKIGGTNYVWSFKQKKDRLAQLQHEKTLELIAQLKPQLEDATARLVDAKKGREEYPCTATSSSTGDGDVVMEGGEDKDDEKKPAASDGDISTTTTTSTPAGSSRTEKLAQLAKLRQQKSALQKELDTHKENDPASLADLQKELKFVKEAAERWTDNIFECQSYLTKKRQMDKKDANKFLGISSGFDYPEV